MTNKQTITLIRDFWLNNMGQRVSYLYDKLSKEKIIAICNDLIGASINEGIYTASLPSEVYSATASFGLTDSINRYLAMVYYLRFICGAQDDTAILRKNLYCSDLQWDSISDIIEDIRGFKVELFKQDGIFDTLIKQGEDTNGIL